jgi:hypothetical protein
MGRKLGVGNDGGETKQRFCIVMTPKLAEKSKRAAWKKRISWSEAIAVALKEWMG